MTTQTLVPCKKPNNLDEQHVGDIVRIKGHRLIGRWSLDDKYYEYDECCDRWFRLDENNETDSE